MNLFAIGSLSVAICCVILGFLTLFFGRTRIHRLLLFFNIVCAIWGFGSFLAGIANTEAEAILGWKIAHLGGVFISVLFYHIVTVIAEIKSRKVLYFGYAQAALFNTLNFSTPIVFPSTRQAFDIYYIEATSLYVVFVLIYVALILLSYYQLFKIRKTTKGYRHTRVMYIIFGFLFGFIGGTSTLLPEFNIDILYPSGNFGVTLYCFVVTYAILRYRLMDINIVIKKSLVYSFLASLLTAVFIILILALTKYLSDVAEVTSFTIAVMSALVIAFLFAPLKNKIQSAVDKVFYKTTYDYYATVQKISYDFAATIELHNTYRLIVDTIFNILKLRRAFLLSDRNGVYETVYFMPAEVESAHKDTLSPSPAQSGQPGAFFSENIRRRPLDRNSALIRLSHSRNIIIREEALIFSDSNTAKKIEEELEPYKGEVVAPIHIDGKPEFLIILGEKLSGDIFSNEDINLIETIANQSAIALKNATLYHKLEQRIVERTVALSRTNEYLQKEIIERRHAEEALKASRDELELRVSERTADLTESNKQLNQEIVERQRVEETLKKTAEEWATTFDSTKDVIILVDSENRVIRANRAGRAFFDLPSNDALHKPLRQMFQSIGMHKDIEPLSAMKKSKRREESEVHFPEKNIWIFFTADPIFDTGNNLLGAVCIIRDITDRKISEEEKASLENQLVQVQKMDSIGRLAGGVAHDFNNLLSAIISYSFLSTMKLPKDSPVREYLKKITETGERAASLTHQLLAFSRKQLLEMKTIDLVAIAKNLEKMLSRLIGENIRIEIKSHFKEGYIKADSVQVEQIIMNLAVNARDAMPNGGILTIDISDIRVDKRNPAVREDVPPGSYIKMSVTDTGEGMCKNVKEKIFEPFFTTKEKGKGTGMGLATVYGIIMQHKGFIFVHSRPGMGATFNIYFPAVRKAQLDGSEIEQEAETLLRGHETILVVDDEPMICRIVEDTLQPLGYLVLLASHSSEALEVCDSFHGAINLLLTDVIMPGLNGRELAARFLQKRPDTKVIYMSGYTDDIIGRHGVLEPGIIFLHKPLSPLSLTRKIREVLDAKIPDMQKTRKS